jgi:NAD(P)-dependent dehydrogenase (short-subunit alcohol dehydrogenase family)
VTDKAQAQGCVAAAVERWGRVDVLVNNAYTGTAGKRLRFEWKDDGDLRRAFELNAMAALWTMNAAFPHMRDQGGGSIVNICSLNGVNAHMGTVQYNAAKEALRSASRTAAREWAAWQIRVNIICPAAKTAASRQVFLENPELEKSADNDNPMRRMGDPEQDIAPVALFLASDDARYVTGNTLFVDGGSHINGSSWAPDLPDEP